MRLGIATDDGGFGVKEELVARIRAAGHEVVDFGAHSLNPDDDYPDYVVPLGQAVVAGKVDRGVAICGSGAGASVGANKANGVRAGLLHDHFSAKEGVEDDPTNILAWADEALARKSLGISSKLIWPPNTAAPGDIFVAWARSPRLNQKGELHEQRQNNSARGQHNPHALD